MGCTGRTHDTQLSAASRRNPVLLVQLQHHVAGVLSLLLTPLACRGFVMRRGRGGGRGTGRGGGGGSGSGSGGTAVPLLAAMASQRVVVLTADGRCVKVRLLLFSMFSRRPLYLLFFVPLFSGLGVARP